MKRDARFALTAAVALLCALAFFAAFLSGQAKTPGIGFTPPPGSHSWWWTGWTPPAGCTTCPAPQLLSAPMDLSARPFGTAVADHQAFVRRYGFDRNLCGSCRFGVDAETILGKGSRSLTQACERNEFGTAATHDCYPTLTELHDYAATHLQWTPVVDGDSGGGATPSNPALVSASSPGPGRVTATWTQRALDPATYVYFELRAGTALLRVPAVAGQRRYTATVELPPGDGGQVAVAVAASTGAAPGPPSNVLRIAVVPRQGEAPTAPPPTPTPAPTPEATPSPTAPPAECPTCLALPTCSSLLDWLLRAGACKP